MKLFLSAILLLLLGVIMAQSSDILQYSLPDFSKNGYQLGVNALFEAFEKESKTKLIPGQKKKVGLKVYTHSGPGLKTPLELVRAVISALESRGFEKKDIFILDFSTLNLRHAGFLPPVSEGRKDFEGVAVYALDTNHFWNQSWFYSSNLPSYESFKTLPFYEADYSKSLEESHKSYLPAPLILDVDFWINLPMVTSFESIGINGALMNGSIWAISNFNRFITGPNNSLRRHVSEKEIYNNTPIAISEIAAIPELRENEIFTLLTLETYQIIGDLEYNAYYNRFAPLLWLSTDPVAIDALMLQRINRHRELEGFPRLTFPALQLQYASILGLGSYENSSIRIIDLSPEPLEDRTLLNP